MKKLLFLASLVAIVMGFAACNDDDVDVPRFQFDADGRCYLPDTKPISHADFLKYAEGNGWKYVSAYKINDDGTVQEEGYYENVSGGSTHTYCFEKDAYTDYFFYNASHTRVYTVADYTYLEDGNQIVWNNTGEDGKYLHMQFQVLSVNENELKVIEYIGIRASDGRNSYVLATYQKMNETEMKSLEDGYIDVNELEFDASHFFRPFGEITEEKFMREVVGYGWSFNYTWEISEDTTYKRKDCYPNGDVVSHYYFEKDTLTRFYQQYGEFVYRKEPYTLMLEEFPYRLVNEATKDTLYLYFTQNPDFEFREVLEIRDGKPVWGFTNYMRMSDKKLQQFREKYSKEVKRPETPYLSYSIKDGVLQMEITDYTINCGAEGVEYECLQLENGVVQVNITETGELSANCFDYTNLTFTVPDLKMGETYQFDVRAKSVGDGIYVPLFSPFSIEMKEGGQGKVLPDWD